ncbi:SET domain-containing protein 3-like [Bradysia coprophila]|uniref:SET domain-containing protein 3-like n=1 Tax=Bradysia coprophila TaxID=38358 RepID=UPI00187D70F5|nr:SET domain-containing protein 3-like [Bradysia coprophila]
MVMWKKGSDALYVDLISEAGPKGICIDTDEQGNIVVADLRSNAATNPLRADKTISTLNKSDATSVEKRSKGNELFVRQQWFEAMEMYNESLCFAEKGSVNASLAYANRAFTFLKLEMYNECFADIELAKKAGYPEMSKLEQRKAICSNSMKEDTDSPNARWKPKLDYDPNEKFPCLANILNIERSGDCDVAVVANEDIAVGRIIAMEESFTVSLHQRFGWKCCICLKHSVNLVPCTNCTVAMFCSDECRESFLHKDECGKMMKCEQMEQMRGILIAINSFANADELMDFVEETIQSDCNETPENLIDTRSKYRIFLKLSLHSKLCGSEFFGAQYVYPIYKFLLDIPRIGTFFNSLKHQRFLMHLIGHHVQIGHRNTRMIKQQNLGDRVMQMESQYSFTGLLQKYFTHSCAPNVQMISFDNMSIYFTVRPVRKGDTLQQSFFPFLQESRKLRQSVLLEQKEIVCKCIRCRGPNASYSMRQRMTQDPDYCYIASNGSSSTQIILNYEELVKRSDDFLTKYGREIWCDEIAGVVTLCITLKRLEIQGFTLQVPGKGGN